MSIKPATLAVAFAASTVISAAAGYYTCKVSMNAKLSVVCPQIQQTKVGDDDSALKHFSQVPHFSLHNGKNW